MHLHVCPVACPAGNGVPIARDDAFTTPQNTPITGTLVGNDIPSADGGNAYSLVAQAAHGIALVHPDGTFTYTPTPGYSGTDSFVYRIRDANGDVSVATVTITIPGVPLRCAVTVLVFPSFFPLS
jgi:hypothetical protein